jgi:integrase
LRGTPYNPDGTPNAEWWSMLRSLRGEPEFEPAPGTFAALIKAYKGSAKWQGMSQSTRTNWKHYLEYVEEKWGDLRVELVRPEHIARLHEDYADLLPAEPQQRTKPDDQYANRPAAANNLLRALSAMLSWSVPRGWRADNPCAEIELLKTGEGYPPWPLRAIEHYKKHGKAHLWWVVAHALYTGQRQSDVLAMKRSDLRDGEIRVVQEKTRKPLWIPLHSDLKAIQAEMFEAIKEARRNDDRPGLSTYLLVNSHGTPWTQDGFRASFQSEMDRRIFAPFRRHRLVFHGLRKSAVVFMLEAGCSTKEVSAITGQSLQMVEHYSEQVSQRKLARAAILKWEQAGRKENKK